MAQIVFRIAVAGLIVAAGWVVGNRASSVAGRAFDGAGVDPRVRQGVVRLLQPAVLLVFFVAALEYLDIDLSTVAAMAGAVTLAIGFGLQPAISNLASGALLLTLRPYRDGEFVECGNGERGRVLEQGPFAVVLERPDGVIVTVPNNATFANAIRNHSRMGRRRVETSFLVSHDVDLDLARRAVVERLRTDPAVLADPPPVVLVTAIDDGGLRLAARVWVRPERYAESASRIAEDVLGILRVSGISVGKVP